MHELAVEDKSDAKSDNSPDRKHEKESELEVDPSPERVLHSS